MQVIKCGGNDIDNPEWLAAMCRIIGERVQRGEVPIIVHGGGKEIGLLQTALGGEPQWVAGLRVSDPTALKAAIAVLNGLISTRIVAHLQAYGIEAMSLSGVDRGLVTVKQLQHPEGDLGFVGQPTRVRAIVLMELLAAGVVPVLAPICSDGSAQTYNVNADVFAGAIATAIAAEEVVFVSNVPGVLINHEPAPNLTASQIHALIADGTIYGGMRPKVETALQSLEQGVKHVRITNIHDLDGGTRISATANQ